MPKNTGNIMLSLECQYSEAFYEVLNPEQGKNAWCRICIRISLFYKKHGILRCINLLDLIPAIVK